MYIHWAKGKKGGSLSNFDLKYHPVHTFLVFYLFFDLTIFNTVWSETGQRACFYRPIVIQHLNF